MAFCTSCGNRVADGAKFCTGCGTPTASASQPVVPQTVVQPQPVAAEPTPTPAPELAPVPVTAAPAPTPVAVPEPAPKPAPVVAAPVAVSAAAAAAPAPVAAVPQAAPVQAATGDATPTQPAKKSSALKIVLIVLLILFILGVLVIGAVVGAGYYAAKKLKEKYNVEQTTNGDVNIKTPFGDINTTEDAEKVAAQMGVDVYPGATPLTEGTAASSFGGISVMSAAFETSDSIDQVEQFYKQKFPNSSVSASDDNKRSMIFGTPKGMVTLTLHNVDGKTKIDISSLEGDKKIDTGSSE